MGILLTVDMGSTSKDYREVIMFELITDPELFVELLHAVAAPVVAVLAWVANVVKLVLVMIVFVAVCIWTIITGVGPEPVAEWGRAEGFQHLATVLFLGLLAGMLVFIVGASARIFRENFRLWWIRHT